MSDLGGIKLDNRSRAKRARLADGACSAPGWSVRERRHCPWRPPPVYSRSAGLTDHAPPADRPHCLIPLADSMRPDRRRRDGVHRVHAAIFDRPCNCWWRILDREVRVRGAGTCALSTVSRPRCREPRVLVFGAQVRDVAFRSQYWEFP